MKLLHWFLALPFFEVGPGSLTRQTKTDMITFMYYLCPSKPTRPVVKEWDYIYPSYSSSHNHYTHSKQSKTTLIVHRCLFGFTGCCKIVCPDLIIFEAYNIFILVNGGKLRRSKELSFEPRCHPDRVDVIKSTLSQTPSGVSVRAWSPENAHSSRVIIWKWVGLKLQPPTSGVNSNVHAL